MSDLYAILRVPRTASPDRIRKAYRKLAMKLRPDRGGDPAAFQAATEAHDVLSDPERRARYDATGETDVPREHAVHAGLMSVLAPCLMAVLEQCGDASRTHVVARMRDALANALREMDGARAKLAKLKGKLEASVSRFTRHDADENLLAAAALAHLAQVEEQLAGADGHRKRLEAALEHLKTCGYTVDTVTTATSIVGGGTYGHGSWATFTGGGW